jgi:DNA-binding transcriptional ArsR family regulator
MKETSYRLFFKAFSNNTRFEIITLLRKGSISVSDIAKKTGFEQSRVSHNLKCLEACGFVNTKWKGKNKIYSLDKKHIIPILKNIEKHIGKYDKRLEHCGVLKNKSCGVIK